MISLYPLADSHFPLRRDYGPWADVGLWDDPFLVFEAVCKRAAERQAHVALAGDVFDGGRPDSEAVARFVRCLRPLREENLKLFYVTGNHDADQDWAAVAGDVAVNVERDPHPEVVGLGYQPSWPPDPFPPEATVGLYHQPWKEFLNRDGPSVYDLPHHTLSVCGDVHVNTSVMDGYFDERVLRYSPGPLVPQGMDEVQHRNSRVGFNNRFYLYPGKPGFEGPESLGRMYWRVDLDDVDPGDALRLVSSPPVAQNGPGDLARPVVVAVGPFPDGWVEAARAASRGGGSHLAVRRGKNLRRQTSAAQAEARRAASATLEAAVADSPLSPEEAALASRLLNARDPAAEADLAREEFISNYRSDAT